MSTDLPKKQRIIAHLRTNKKSKSRHAGCQLGIWKKLNFQNCAG